MELDNYHDEEDTKKMLNETLIIIFFAWMVLGVSIENGK